MVVISTPLRRRLVGARRRAAKSEPGDRTAQRVAIVALVALGVLTVIAASGSDIGPRWFGVASVLFFVPALSLPLLRLAGAENGVGR